MHRTRATTNTDRTGTTRRTGKNWTGPEQRAKEPNRTGRKNVFAPDRTGPRHLALGRRPVGSGAYFRNLSGSSPVATGKSNAGFDRANKIKAPDRTKKCQIGLLVTKHVLDRTRPKYQKHRMFGFLHQTGPDRIRPDQGHSQPGT